MEIIATIEIDLASLVTGKPQGAGHALHFDPDLISKTDYFAQLPHPIQLKKKHDYNAALPEILMTITAFKLKANSGYPDDCVSVRFMPADTVMQGDCSFVVIRQADWLHFREQIA